MSLCWGVVKKFNFTTSGQSQALFSAGKTFNRDKTRAYGSSNLFRQNLSDYCVTFMHFNFPKPVLKHRLLIGKINAC